MCHDDIFDMTCNGYIIDMIFFGVAMSLILSTILIG